MASVEAADPLDSNNPCPATAVEAAEPMDSLAGMLRAGVSCLLLDPRSGRLLAGSTAPGASHHCWLAGAHLSSLPSPAQRLRMVRAGTRLHVRLRPLHLQGRHSTQDKLSRWSLGLHRLPFTWQGVVAGISSPARQITPTNPAAAAHGFPLRRAATRGCRSWGMQAWRPSPRPPCRSVEAALCSWAAAARAWSTSVA